MQRVRSAVRSLPVLELPAGLLGDAEPSVVPAASQSRPLGWRRRGRGRPGRCPRRLVDARAPSALSVDDLNSRFGARVSLDPAFGPAKVMVPDLRDVTE